VANGVVYVGSDDDKLYALDAATGSKLWSYPDRSLGWSPAVVNGVVYACTYYNQGYAYVYAYHLPGH